MQNSNYLIINQGLPMVDIMFQKCALLAMSKIPQNMPEKSLSMLLQQLVTMDTQ